MRDNAVGLAAYILEKFSTCTNPDYRKLEDGGLDRDFNIDALLDNIMIYYLSNSITTAVRIYSEAFGGLDYALSRVHTHVPVACARFKNEIMHQFDFIIKEKFRNLIQSNQFDDGGHFAALQLPKVLYEDILSFVQKTVE